jgi:hypothetical protein
MVLPLALLLLVPLWPLAEWVAKQIPALGLIVTGVRVNTERPGKYSPQASFYTTFHGWGNPHRFEITSAVIVYSGVHKQFDDLYVRLPRMQGRYTSSPPGVLFPVSRQVVLDYVRRSDDFQPGEAETFANELWGLLHQYVEKRDLPPMINYFNQGPEPRIVWYVEDDTILGVACLLAILPLLLVSWVLARRYVRRVNVV